MYPQPIRRMQDHPPIAQLVTKPLDQQCAVGGYHCGSGALVVQQSPQVVGGIVVETQTRTTCAECRTVQGGQLAGEGAECGAELGGAAGIVSAPERQSGRLARRGDHQHPVVGDLGDSPAGGTQRDHVTGAGLVNHFLVEFAYPRRPLGSEVDGEQPAIGNGAAGGDGQSLGSGSRGQRAGIAVIHQPRPQLSELGGWVLAGQQVQGGLEQATRQGRERGGPPHGVEPRVGIQRFQRSRRHRVLGQNVEWVGRHPHGLDLTGKHALHADRAAE
ncbi:Uncharacterised protein [Mycobacterium tuberculosis]|nr:Uncharacterised protein [Mycobacterium tuberculosis]